MKKAATLTALLLVVCLLCGCAGKTAPNPLEDARLAASAGQAPDFEALQWENPDICAWIVIPGTKINDPVYCPRDGAEKPYHESGLYTQRAYSDRDFLDPTTVVYGPLTEDGSLFGELQRTFSEDGSLSRCGAVTVYTPNRTLRYQVFASSLFHDVHLMHTYDELRDTPDREAFLSDLKNYHVMSHQWDESVTLSESDRLLILSTHTLQNEDLRYLVLAKAVDETD